MENKMLLHPKPARSLKNLWANLGTSAGQGALAILSGAPAKTALCCCDLVAKDTARASLKRVRALILRRAFGAMRTTPVAAMRVLLGIEPLHLAIVAAAAATAYKLKCVGKWTVGVGHTRIPREIQMETVLEMRQNRMPRRVGEARGAIRNGDVWYTDGSKTDGGAGAGIFGSRGGFREAPPLGEFTTVFQAEVVAIMSCAQTLIASGETDRRIRICSDSRATLGALRACVFDSWLVWGCKGALDRLSADNDVALVWVSGQSRIKGNEIADELARSGSSASLVGSEPALGLPNCSDRAKIKDWLRDRHMEGGNKDQVPARALLGEVPSRNLARSIRALRRGEARLAVQIYMGHDFTNYHMHKLGLSDNPKCRKCEHGKETTLHVLCECPAYAGHRRLLLDSIFLEPEQ
ncbi:PREDICTED: uncharacterized protein LOC108769326, partial [Trachymyrmex cornetzi]|uniref:uncharacterized protein LOC108769326 n=1 Tax=Trachymyrmex cornetzi TaxID=471704 RepID=UPI00084F61C9